MLRSLAGGRRGGGPPGLLAKRGAAPRVFEKGKGGPEKAAGEFLSQKGRTNLAALGLSAQSLGSLAIGHVRLVRRRHAPTQALPFAAQSLSRRVLDEALLKRAAEAGAAIERGARVKGVAQEAGGWAVQIEGSGT